MASVENNSEKRSIIFWGLTVSCLALSIFMIFKTLHSYYQIYFGSAAKGLSERMGAEAYKEFLEQHLGLDMFVLAIITFAFLALSMITMIRKKYAFGKLALAGYLFCTALSYAVVFAHIGFDVELPPLSFAAIAQISIFLGVVSALFYYGTKYQRHSVLA